MKVASASLIGVENVNGWDAYIMRLNPVQWKSPAVGIGRRKGGQVYPQVYKDDTLRTYQLAVKEIMENTVPLPYDGPIDLRFLFWRQLELSSDREADVTNLQKALEDALQGVLFGNDRFVRSIESYIMEQLPTTEPLIVIHVRAHQPSGWERVEWHKLVEPNPEPTDTGPDYDTGGFF